MPCNCDHLNPSEREQRLQHAAKLQVYVWEKLGQRPPAWLAKEANNIYARDDHCETDLCAMLTGMGEAEREALVYGSPKDPMSRKLADWWERHQEADRKREASEKATQDKEALRKQALAKLSQEERDALELKP